VLFNQFLTGMVDTGGNVGETFKRITSKEGMTQTATAMFTAGALEYLNTLTFGQNGLPLGKINIANSPFVDVLGKNLIYGVTGAATLSALTGESFEDQLPAVFALALLQSGAASAAFAIGDTKSLSSNMNLFLHTVVGCGVGAIKQDSSEGCAPGALGALAAKVWANENGAQIRAESATPEDANKTILDQSTFAGTIAGCIVGGSEGCSTGGMTGNNAILNNYLTQIQWDDFANELAAATTDEERKKINEKYAAISKAQDAQLALCDLFLMCQELAQEVRDGTDKLLELVQTGKLPEGYAGAADLQFMGQRLSTDAGFRRQVGGSLNYMAWCTANESACNQDQLNKAIALALPVLTPLLIGYTGGLAIDALVSSGRMLASEATLLGQLGVQNYCAINPLTCVAIAETAFGIGTNSNAPSVLPVSSPGKVAAASTKGENGGTAAKSPSATDATATSPYSSSGTSYGKTTTTDANGKPIATQPTLPSAGANGGTDAADGLAFRTDLPSHMIGPDGFTKSGQLSGTHNLTNATSSLDTVGATYTLNPTATVGIYEVPYTYINPATGKVVSGSKTVYDPAVFSDQTMLDNAQQAGQQAWKQYSQNPTDRVIDVSVGGVNFRSYINIDKNGNAFIGNVHPIK
jgi:hypothetical protein